MSFETAFTEVLKTEAGFVGDPDDRGGATNFGITQKTLSEFMGHEASEADIRNIDMNIVRTIYHQNYWDRLSLDRVQSPAISYFLFDQAVNRGARKIAEQVQTAVGVKADGAIGPITIAAINARDPRKLLIEMVKMAQISYAKIVENDLKQGKFIEGWIRRTHKFLDLV